MSYFDNDNEDILSVGGSDNEADEASSDEDSVVLSSKKIIGGKVKGPVEEGELEEQEEEDDDEEEEDDDEEEELDDEEDDDESMTGGGKDDELEEGEIDEEAEKKTKRTKKVPAKSVYKKPEMDEDDDDEDDDDGEIYLQKFDKSINNNYIVDFHPECVLQNYDEILSMTKVIRDKDGIIIDDLHRTVPYLTKYERARILGQRAKQINSGASPFIKVPENVIDGYVIAELELKEKRVPFIIRRPMPNGGSEYWSLKDLEDISF